MGTSWYQYLIRSSFGYMWIEAGSVFNKVCVIRNSTKLARKRLWWCLSVLVTLQALILLRCLLRSSTKTAEYLETLIWIEDWDFSRKGLYHMCLIVNSVRFFRTALFTVFLDFVFCYYLCSFLWVFHVVYYGVVYHHSLVSSITLTCSLLINNASIIFVKIHFSPALASEIFWNFPLRNLSFKNLPFFYWNFAKYTRQRFNSIDFAFVSTKPSSKS